MSAFAWPPRANAHGQIPRRGQMPTAIDRAFPATAKTEEENRMR
jgi:hypothetical protein